MLRPRNLIILAMLVAGVVLVLSVEWGRMGPEAAGVSTEAEPVVIGRTYRVDDGYARRTGETPPVGFQLILPKRPEEDHEIRVVEQPEGGIAQFNFYDADESFMESLFIAPISIPTGEMDARLAALGPRLAEQGPALLEARFEEVTAEPVREVRVGAGGAYRALELTGRYLDSRDGTRYSYRFLALPDPERAQSVYAVSHVNRDHLEIESAEGFAQSLTGKALSTLRLTAPPAAAAGGEARAGD